MKKTRVTITLDKELEDWLREASASCGKSVSQIIRRCLSEFSAANADRYTRNLKGRSSSEASWLRDTKDSQ